MKIHKKLLMGLSLLFMVVALLFNMSHHAAAAPACKFIACSPSDVSSATFTIKDQNNIIGVFGGNSVVFTDTLNDGHHDFEAAKGQFCSGGAGGGQIKIDGSDWDKFTTATGPSTVNAQIDVDYYDSSDLSVNPCHDTKPNQLGVKLAADAKAGSTNFQWNNNTIVSGDGKDTLSSLSADGRLYGASACGGTTILLDKAKGGSGQQYTLTSDPFKGRGNDASKDPRLSSYYKTATKCFIQDGPKSVTIGGTSGKPSTAASITGVTGGTAAGQTPATCESSSSIGLEWIVCPLLKSIDGIVTWIYGVVNDQLCIQAGTSETAGGVTCGSSSATLLTPQVHQAWSVIRYLSTAIIIIIMLIMIISQAIGSGLFDAYTIKKVLPRLVGAVILIQLSWFISKLAIDIFNDIGTGIADLMKAPFEPHVDSIDWALGQIGSSGVLAGFGLVVGSIAAIAISGITIGGVLIMSLTVMAALLVGFLVLLFRKALLLMSVILLPIALTALILPGTEKYWKLWRENFVKLLAMFPLIAMLIAGGHIFGYVAGNTGGSVVALFAVLVGFFGPLFFLPKTYKWGGSALSSLSGAVIDSTKSLRRKPLDYAMGKAKIEREQRQSTRSERLANNRGRRFDALWAGRFNMALGRTARRNQYQDTLERGRKAADESATRAVIGGHYEELTHPQKVQADILVAQGRADTVYGTGLDGREAAQQRAALERLAKYGDWDAISAVRQAGFQGEQGERIWRDFTAAHIGDMHQNAPHLSPQRTDLSSIAYREFFNVKDFEFDEILRQATGGLVRNGDTGQLVPVAPGDEARKRASHIAQARRALADTQFMAGIGEHGRSVFERIASMSQLSPQVQVIEADRSGGAPTVLLPDGAQLRANPAAATESIREHLVSADAAVATQTRIELAHRLADPNLGAHDPDRVVYENALAVMRQQAAGDRTSAAGQAYNAVISEWETRLTDIPADAAQAATARGESAPDIARAQATAQAAVAAEQARMRAQRLTGIP